MKMRLELFEVRKNEGEKYLISKTLSGDTAFDVFIDLAGAHEDGQFNIDVVFDKKDIDYLKLDLKNVGEKDSLSDEFIRDFEPVYFEMNKKEELMTHIDNL